MPIELSIIVPVYNLVELLPRCIDSILNQTFRNFELILVNDGSTDHSSAVCHEYAKKDARVRVIDKVNGGVASARNAGLDVAEGTYVGFVDNDDYIHPNMYEILIDTARTYSSTIVVCDFLKVNEETSLSDHLSPRINQMTHFDYLEASDQLFSDNRVTFVCPWNKLYRRELFTEIRYEVGSITDDETVAHKLYYLSKKTTYIKAALYYYVQRPESQMGTFSIKRFDAVYALKDRELFYKEKNEIHLHKKALIQYAEKFFWYYYFAKTSMTQIDAELSELKGTFNRSLMDLLKHQEISVKQKLMFILFRIHPPLFEWIRDRFSTRQVKV